MPLPWRAMATLLRDRLLQACTGVLAIAGALAAVAGAVACLVVLYRLASQDPIERWALAGPCCSWPPWRGVSSRACANACGRSFAAPVPPMPRPSRPLATSCRSPSEDVADDHP